MDTIDHLRTATEVDVIKALEVADVALPITTPTDLVEAYNRVLDQMLGLPEESSEAET